MSSNTTVARLRRLCLAIALFVVFDALVVSSSAVICTAEHFRNEEPSDESVTELFVRRDRGRVQLNVPPRLMWGWGGTVVGFCGSASLQSAALYYGSWISQQIPRWETAVRIGDGSTSENATDYAKLGAKYRLLIEHFDNQGLDTPQADLFVDWVRQQVIDGNVVIAAMYARFPRGESDPDYDHISPIIGVTMDNLEHQYSNFSLTRNTTWDTKTNKTVNITNLSANITTNVTGIVYNDLNVPYARVMRSPLTVNRADYFLEAGEAFSPQFALPQTVNFGVAVGGVVDLLGETYRTKLTAWSWTEPDWSDEDRCNEEPALLNLSIAVYGLRPGTEYSILRFDGNESIPSFNFLAGNYSKRWDFVATSETYSASPFDTVMTDTMASYRTVATRGNVPTPTAAPFILPPEVTEPPEESEISWWAAATIGVVVTASVAALSFVLYQRCYRGDSSRRYKRQAGEDVPLLPRQTQPQQQP